MLHGLQVCRESSAYIYVHTHAHTCLDGAQIIFGIYGRKMTLELPNPTTWFDSVKPTQLHHCADDSVNEGETAFTGTSRRIRHSLLTVIRASALVPTNSGAWDDCSGRQVSIDSSMRLIRSLASFLLGQPTARIKMSEDYVLCMCVHVYIYIYIYA